VVGLGTITTDAGASEMLKDIDALLSNLAVAFTSSLAGILGSLILLFVRSYNIAKVEMKAGVLRHTLLRQGYTWTPEQTLASIQKATEDMRQEALQIKDGINDQAERLGTMATDIASQLGTQMSQVLVPHLQSMHEGLHDFAQHQSAQQTEMLGAMAQDFAQEIQGTLHQHFEDLTQALEDSRSWYQDMHSLFTQSLQALSEQVNLQREHQQRQEAFFTKASQDMVTMSQHREDIIDKELALFEHYQAIIKRLQETGEATGQSSKLIQDSVANLESILDMHKHLQNSLLQSQDKIYEQFTQSTNTLGSVGERFREDVEAVRSELSEGLQETFKEFDTGSAAVVNHLSGSFAMMLQLLESLEKNILHMQNSVNSLEKSVQLVHKPALPSPVAAHNTPGR
jgi:hypothetical protein